jgi:hypothetical protein
MSQQLQLTSINYVLLQQLIDFHLIKIAKKTGSNGDAISLLIK